jgi:hypothetical protein
MYDDSADFEQYLAAQGLPESMKRLNLHMKVEHTITPKVHLFCELWVNSTDSNFKAL